MRSTPLIALLALAFAQPGHAQQVDQQTRQQVTSIIAQYFNAMNRGDGQAWAALFGPNPINIGPSGKMTDPAKLQSVIETAHQQGLTVTANVQDVELLLGGKEVVATASYSAAYKSPAMQQVQGNFLFVLERSGDAWKIDACSATRSLPPSSGKGMLQLAQSGP